MNQKLPLNWLHTNLHRAPLHQLSIIIGAHDIEDQRYQDEQPQYFSVAEVRLHPNFRFSASHPDRYDVAVLRLDKAAKYADNILPVCLPPKGIHFEGWYGVVTGWGKTDPALSKFGEKNLRHKVKMSRTDLVALIYLPLTLWHLLLVLILTSYCSLFNRQ